MKRSDSIITIRMPKEKTSAAAYLAGARTVLETFRNAGGYGREDLDAMLAAFEKRFALLQKRSGTNGEAALLSEVHGLVIDLMEEGGHFMRSFPSRNGKRGAPDEALTELMRNLGELQRNIVLQKTTSYPFFT